MKTIVCILAFFTVMGMQAQEPHEEDFDQRPSKRMRHSRMDIFKDMSPEQVAEISAKKLTLALDLSDSQQQQVASLLVVETTRKRAKHEERKSLKEKGEKPSGDEIHAKMIKGLDQRIEFKRKMKDVLNDEQYLKWTEMQEQKHKMKRRSRAKRHAKRKK